MDSVVVSGHQVGLTCYNTGHAYSYVKPYLTMLSFSLKYMIINIRLRQRNWYVSHTEKSTALAEREPYLCKGYSPCCCRGTTQRTRWIAKWKELPLKRLLNDQQLCAAATAGVRRKQGKMLATNKQETSCWYVHVHTLFRCVF